MKKSNLIFIFLIISHLMFFKSYGQSGKKYHMSVFFSEGSVDTRIFGVRPSIVKDFRLKNELSPPDKTFFLQLSVGKSIYNKSNLETDLGLFIAYQRNNYIRPFKHCVIDDPCFLIVEYLDIYSYYLLGTKVDILYKYAFKNNIKIGMGFETDISFKYLSYYKETILSFDDNYFWDFDFFSVQVYPKMIIQKNNYDISFLYRLFHLQKVDRAIHTKLNSTGNPVLVNDYEIYNLPKFGISLKYYFNLKNKSK